MDPADVVLRFLDSVGSRREADFYLALFRAGEPERFAAISVDANVARQAAEAVTLDLRFLAALGLFPVVLLGLFESTEATEHAVRLARRLERAGVRAIVLGANEPDAIARAAEAARAQAIPIVTFPVGAEARFETLGAMVAALRTRKLIFLHRPGGLRQQGQLVPLVNLTTDYAAVVHSRELSRKERTLVEESRRLVERTPHRLSIAITSPLNLFRELFTIKGAGTLLRRGAAVERVAADALDRERMRALLTSSFGRAPLDDFFARPIARAYVALAPRGDSNTPRGDSNTPRGDSNTPRSDSNTPRGDSNTPRSDSNTLRSDSNTPRSDSNTPRGDSNAPRGDGFAPRGEDNAPRGERLAPRGEGLAPRSEGNVLRGDGNAPRSERNAPRGDGLAPRGDGNAPRGEGHAPRSEGLAPRGDGNAPRGDGNAPRGDGNAPRGDGNAPRGEGNAPRGEGNATRGDGHTPRGDGLAPRDDGNAPRGEGNAPRGDGLAPRSEGKALRSEVLAPRGEGNASRSEGNAPRGEGLAPRGEGLAPRGEGNALRGDDYALRSEVLAPRGEGNASRSEGNAPRGDGYALRSEVLAPRREGLTPRGEGLAPRGEGLAPRGEEPAAIVAEPTHAADAEEQAWRGVALVVETPLGAYLSKFAVDAEAQGEGIGRDLWQALAADYDRIFWRARASNAIGPWYVKLCDGMMRFPDWHIFWKGLPPDAIPDAIAYALAQPVDLP